MGFDLRLHRSTLPALWDDLRRDTYLLRRDVSAPLSVDSLVWPRPAWLDAIERWNSSDPWSSLDELVSLAGDRIGSSEIIAVAGVCQDAPHNWPEPMKPAATDVNPGEISSEWSFLGYDVADWYSDVSALSNTAYDQPSKVRREAAWGPRLNKHHLFHGLIDAWNFARFSDSHIPEHAPFCVFGVWLIANRTSGR